MRTLITIPISHYCEKARWALDRAGLEYIERRHVQGLHMLVARRAGGGRTVPVLVTPEGVLPESEEIVRYADAALPEDERLFPADEALAAEVAELSRGFDERLGPDGRRWIYARMLSRRDQLFRVNNQGIPDWEAGAMIAGWPFLRGLITRVLSVDTDPGAMAADEAHIWRTFDEVAERLADGRPYLCGERFTAADVTFACLATPVVAPPQYGLALPSDDEMPPDVLASFMRFRAHPAGAFAMRLYAERRHRRA